MKVSKGAVEMKFATIFAFVVAVLFLGSGISSQTLSSVLPSITVAHAEEEDMEEPVVDDDEMMNEEMTNSMPSDMTHESDDMDQ